MKKLSIIIFAFIFFFSFKLSLATEGTCSWHGGVNCDAGSDWDGSAICNDGWKDSSESFSAQCSYSCKNESDLALLKTNLINSGTMRYAQQNSDGLIKACEQSIKNYQNSNNDINNFDNSFYDYADYADQLNKLTELKKELELKNVCQESYGIFSTYNKESATCSCKSGYFLNKKTLSCEIEPLCPTNTENLNGSCVCSKGYYLLDKECASATNVCINKNGKNSHPYYDADLNLMCTCNNGYIFNSEKQCVIKPKPVKYISVVAKKYGNLNDCNNIEMSETEKQECREYRALGYSYDYQVYPDVQINQPSSLPASSKDNTKEKPLNNIKNIEQQNKPKLIKTYSSSSLLSSSISSSTTSSSASSTFLYQKISSSTSSSLIANVEKPKTKRSISMISSFFRKWFK